MLAGVVVTALGVTAAVVLTRGTGGNERTAGAKERQDSRLAWDFFLADPAATSDGRDQELTSVAASGPVVVVVGGESDPLDASRVVRPLFVTSLDAGRSWRTAQVRTPEGDPAPYDQAPRKIVGSPGGWLARADDGTLWTSRDATTWIRRPDGAGTAFTSGDQIIGVVATARGWVAIGMARGDGPLHGTPVLWLSADGSRWERRTPGGFGLKVSEDTVAFTQIALLQGTITVQAIRMKHIDRSPSRRDISWSSQDGGHSWKVAGKTGNRRVQRPKSAFDLLPHQPLPRSATLPAGQALLGAAVSGPQTILVGRTEGGSDADPVLTVRDGGGHDTPVDLARVAGVITRDTTVRSLASSGSRVVAAGSSDGRPALWTTGDGTSWSRARLPGTLPGGRLLSVTSGPSGWLAVGAGLVLTSADGTDWQRPGTTPSSAAPTVAVGGPQGYVVVAQEDGHSVVWHSADLVTWTQSPSPGTLRAVTSLPAGFAAVGDISGRSTAWTSADGRQWTPADLAAPAGTVLTGVAARDSALVAAGAKGGAPTSYLSSDGGRTWQRASLPGTGTVTTLTATSDGFFATGETAARSGADVTVWTSGDGRSWRFARPRGTGLRGPGSQRINAVVPWNGGLTVVGASTDEQGVQPTLWRVSARI